MIKSILKDLTKSSFYLSVLFAAIDFASPLYVAIVAGFTAVLCLVDDWYDEARGWKDYAGSIVFFAATAAAALYLSPVSHMLFLVASVSVMAAAIPFWNRPSTRSSKTLIKSTTAQRRKLLGKDIVKSILYLAMLAAATFFAGPWYVVFTVAFTTALSLVDDLFDESRHGRHYLSHFLFFVATLAAALYLAPYSLWHFLLFDAVALVALVACRNHKHV